MKNQSIRTLIKDSEQRTDRKPSKALLERLLLLGPDTLHVWDKKWLSRTFVRQISLLRIDGKPIYTYINTSCQREDWSEAFEGATRAPFVAWNRTHWTVWDIKWENWTFVRQISLLRIDGNPIYTYINTSCQTENWWEALKGATRAPFVAWNRTHCTVRKIKWENRTFVRQISLLRIDGNPIYTNINTSCLTNVLFSHFISLTVQCVWFQATKGARVTP